MCRDRAGVRLALLGTALFLGACAATTPRSPAAPRPGTAGALAAEGRPVFAANCAACHGDRGQGLTAPALIGPDADLATFGTGRVLYDYVRSNMPEDRPGALSSPDYRRVVAYLVVQGGVVPSDQTLSDDTLDSVRLPH